MTAPSATGRAFDIVRDAIDSIGAKSRPRGEHALMASCPLHDDTNPSLSVAWKPRTNSGVRGGGVVLLHCFSCGVDAADIAAGLGLRMTDLFDDEPPKGRAVNRPGIRSRPRQQRPTRAAARPRCQWRRVRVYTYTTAGGEAVQQVIREECCCQGQHHKRFLQRYYQRENRQWVWRKPDNFIPVLYRAVELANADRNQWVWLVEGEKDADTAAALGQLATTNAQGAHAFPVELDREFAGRNVAIVIDRDLAGYQRALTLHDQLQHHARCLVFLLPNITAAKADLTDHVAAGRWNPALTFGGLVQTTRDAIALHTEHA
jgi:hypothetical protein